LLKPETGPSDQLRFYREVSPINYLRKDGPPLLMIQGDKDTTIPVHHAYYMQEKAKACSAPVEILIVKNAGHCWGKVDAPIEPPLNDIVKRTVDFLAAELSRKKVLE
jgi:dipeptidyl aminopeptidase/acylaminoacyl peptidase